MTKTLDYAIVFGKITKTLQRRRMQIMKEKFKKILELDFIGLPQNNPKAGRYMAINQIIKGCPGIIDAIHKDLTAGVETNAGRKGITADQVLRFLIVKLTENLSYRKLAEDVEDSRVLYWFCQIQSDSMPKHSAIAENIKKITADTLQDINNVLILLAQEIGFENGKAVRYDATAVETNIHYPTDNSLIWDCVRVATRLAERAQNDFLGSLYYFPDRTKIVKTLNLKIMNARGPKADQRRIVSYKELINYGEEVYLETLDLYTAVRSAPCSSPMHFAKQIELLEELKDLLLKFDQVLDQTERRVLNGEKVHARDKLYSIFEDHTDILQKSGRDTVFGHKIFLSGGKSNMILDCLIERGNPNDTTFFRELVERHIEQFGFAPKKTACDGGFYSQANADFAKAAGVRDVFFSKGSKAKLKDYVKSTWIYKQLRRFRNGVEACISWLKRCFGLDRCNWSGWESFQSYIWSGIISYNLNLLANHKIQ